MKLKDLYQSLSQDERFELAKKVGLKETGYLWQLATNWRGKRPSLDFMVKLAAADSRLTVAELAEEFAETAKAA